MLGYIYWKKFGLKIARAKPFPIQISQHFSNLVILYTYLPMKMEQTVFQNVGT